MMFAIDEKRRPHADADKTHAGKTLADPWSDWRPQWTGQRTGPARTPQDVQERHSPTKSVTAHTVVAQADNTRQRRVVDARLWEAMSPAQQNAACDIAAAFEMMGRGMGYVQSNWQRIPGCSGASHALDVHTRLIKTYVSWAERCAREKVSHALVIDVLCFGFTCRALDRDRRLKNGNTRENLMRGLTLYCKVRGWG